MGRRQFEFVTTFILPVSFHLKNSTRWINFFQILGFGSQSKSNEELHTLDQNDLPEEEYREVKRDALLQGVQTQDLISYGLIPEFVGRIGLVVALHSLTEDMLIQILTEPKNALVKQCKLYFSMDNVSSLDREVC